VVSHLTGSRRPDRHRQPGAAGSPPPPTQSSARVEHHRHRRRTPGAPPRQLDPNPPSTRSTTACERAPSRHDRAGATGCRRPRSQRTRCFMAHPARTAHAGLISTSPWPGTPAQHDPAPSGVSSSSACSGPITVHGRRDFAPTQRGRGALRTEPLGTSCAVGRSGGRAVRRVPRVAIANDAARGPMHRNRLGMFRGRVGRRRAGPRLLRRSARRALAARPSGHRVRAATATAAAAVRSAWGCVDRPASRPLPAPLLTPNCRCRTSGRCSATEPEVSHSASRRGSYGLAARSRAALAIRAIWSGSCTASVPRS